ncbi:UNVERIFIED_CONTAM: hypothetical protein FKN15_070280 [Acipenser sinensis]
MEWWHDHQQQLKAEEAPRCLASLEYGHWMCAPSKTPFLCRHSIGVRWRQGKSGTSPVPSPGNPPCAASFTGPFCHLTRRGRRGGAAVPGGRGRSRCKVQHPHRGSTSVQRPQGRSGLAAGLKGPSGRPSRWWSTCCGPEVGSLGAATSPSVPPRHHSHGLQLPGCRYGNGPTTVSSPTRRGHAYSSFTGSRQVHARAQRRVTTGLSSIGATARVYHADNSMAAASATITTGLSSIGATARVYHADNSMAAASATITTGLSSIGATARVYHADNRMATASTNATSGVPSASATAGVSRAESSMATANATTTSGVRHTVDSIALHFRCQNCLCGRSQPVCCQHYRCQHCHRQPFCCQNCLCWRNQPVRYKVPANRRGDSKQERKQQTGEETANRRGNSKQERRQQTGEETANRRGDSKQERKQQTGEETANRRGNSKQERRQQTGEETANRRGDSKQERKQQTGEETANRRGNSKQERRQQTGEETANRRGDSKQERKQQTGEETANRRGDSKQERRQQTGEETANSWLHNFTLMGF